jgi:hypothetical protein
MENGFLVFCAGVFFCFVLVTLVTRVFANRNCNYFYYVFSVFAFTAMVDLDIAFTLDKVMMPWVLFYLKVRAISVLPVLTTRKGSHTFALPTAAPSTGGMVPSIISSTFIWRERWLPT